MKIAPKATTSAMGVAAMWVAAYQAAATPTVMTVAVERGKGVIRALVMLQR